MKLACSINLFGQQFDGSNDSVTWLQLLLGNKAGSVRLFDIREKKTLREVQMDAAYPRYGQGSLIQLCVFSAGCSEGCPSGLDSDTIELCA